MKNKFRNKIQPCKYPFTSLLIHSDQSVQICSASSMKLGHLDEIDDLQKFFETNSLLHKVQEDFKQGKFHNNCSYCADRVKKNIPSSYGRVVSSKHYPWDERVLKTKSKKVWALDLALSNLCNQNCSMCGSKYSSKWVEFDKQALEKGLTFRGDDFSLKTLMKNKQLGLQSIENIRKIELLIPSLNLLKIKGGEPLADKNCFRLLEAIAEENRELKVHINTNLTLCSKKFIELAKKLPNLEVSVSIDGIYSQYEWVRGTSFHIVEKNLKYFYEQIGKKVNVNATVSLYTLVNLEQQLEYFFSKKEIDRIILITVTHPRHCQPMLLSEETIFNVKTQVESNRRIRDNYYRIIGLNILNSLESSSTPNDRKNALNWVEYVNEIRGLNIYDEFPVIRRDLERSYVR